MIHDVNPIIDRLIEAFPACFDRAAPKPLKIGLGPELLTLAGGGHPALAGLTRPQLRQALRVYTQLSAYQRALAAGGPRYGLDGQPAGEITPEQQAFARLPRQKKTAVPANRPATSLTDLIALLPEIIAMAIPGKLDVTLKINELPQAKPATPQTVLFAVRADGRTVVVELKNKAWNGLKTAVEHYPQWVAAITGKLGEPIEGGFRLENPAVQVFEKRAKPEAALAPEAPPVAPEPAATPESAPIMERPKLTLKGRQP